MKKRSWKRRKERKLLTGGGKERRMVQDRMAERTSEKTFPFLLRPGHSDLPRDRQAVSALIDPAWNQKDHS